jgi:hypothetical protein
MTWNVYLSGEIHSDWREQIIEGSNRLELPLTNRSRSQRCRRRHARPAGRRLLARS